MLDLSERVLQAKESTVSSPRRRPFSDPTEAQDDRPESAGVIERVARE